MAARPNLVWSATMITLRDTSIILRSDPTTSGLLLLNPRSVTPPVPMIATSAASSPSICSQKGPRTTLKAAFR
jgi:hypothetical protein